jgi:hypothetical protein
VKVVATGIPLACHVCTGLHRCRGYTTQPVERSHVPIRDRLRGGRGLRTVRTGQQFLESFEALHALRRDMVKLRILVPRYRPTQASVHETARAMVAAAHVLGMQFKKPHEKTVGVEPIVIIIVSPICPKHPTTSLTQNMQQRLTVSKRFETFRPPK